MIKIVDGSNKLHRTFYEGQTPFGVHPLRDLYLQFINPIHPTFVVWDGPYGNKRRQEIYPPYKQQRKEKAEDTKAAFDIMKQVLLYCPVTQIEIPGWEADDVIATLARKFAKEGQEVQIDTNDGDFWQLVGDNISVPILSNKNINYLPSYTPLVKALVGDPADNIPGWKGFGPKAMESMSHLFDVMNNCLYMEDYNTWADLPWPKRITPDYETFYQCCIFYKLVKMYKVPDEDFDDCVITGQSKPSMVEEIFHPLHI